MKKVLITGATGFIGRNCLPLLLNRNYEVHAVSTQKILSDSLKIHWHQANLLNLQDVTSLIDAIKPTHLLHFAWFAVPEEFWSSLKNFSWVRSSLHLLECFAAQCGERVVMAGTCAEYDWRFGYLSERTTPLSPDSVYGSCKHSMQILLGTFAQQVGLSSAWGRVFFLYGPYENSKRLVSSVIFSLLQNKPALCSHGNQIRDFLYVEDVASAFVTLLDSSINGSVNVASGIPITLKDIIFEISSLLGKEDLVRLGAIPSPENDPKLLVADVSRLADELCWQPQYNLLEGLKTTIEWGKSQIS